MSEEELIKQWFEAFTEKYMRQIEQTVYHRVRNQAWVEDVIQDVYYRVWRYRKKMRLMERKPVEIYLRNIIRSAISDFYKNKDSQLILNSDILSFHSKTCGGAYTQPEHHIILQEYLKILEELSRQEKDILVMRILYNMGYKEIGAMYHIKETAARKRYERAIRKIRKKVKEIFPT
ncbi:RNA polymerase sigma-70 factor (ECF subfamily) [Catenibacillus scindens]|uniref:RNA polymerase sigma-70 factor (ECF subfamily) n=1 Tax=Catenibacillus scindens TaxID=673271 RepID=A0A7W8HBG2_9FIRM|nr:RNA polymerase sigma-70 factor (ECF subfamily) [Catenibacillus scindens]